jgi:hypothetical protein
VIVVKEGHTQRTPVIQLFERHVLKYAETTPDAFKVEMGNGGSSTPAGGTPTAPDISILGAPMPWG